MLLIAPSIYVLTLSVKCCSSTWVVSPATISCRSTGATLAGGGLPAVLNQRDIAFCMRVEQSGNGGFACVRQFLRSALDEQMVTLRAPDLRDALDYECPAMALTVRLVRHVAPTGKVRVLMTNLLDRVRYPASQFGDLYHQRWRIEEAFKRLKHRLNLEHISGLSQRAVAHDLAAKVLCDNLQALTTLTAHACHELPHDRRINRA